MKQIISIFILALIAGVYSTSAQSVSYTVKTSAKCTNLTAEFTVQPNKVANVQSLDVVPIFRGCTSTTQTLTTINVYIKNKVDGANAKPIVYYKKTLDQKGLVTESVAISTLKLNSGTYVLEVSPSAGTEATLTIELFDN